MNLKEELMLDFSVNIPRIIVAGDLAIVDNVKRIVMMTENQIIVHNGSKYTSVEGDKLVIKELREERMYISGDLEQIRFFSTL